MSKQTRIVAGTPKGTFPMIGTDVAQPLADVELQHVSDVNRKPVTAMITVEDYNLRYTVGNATPTVAPALGHLMKPGDVIYLECISSIETFKFINAGIGEDTTIMVSVGF